MKWRSRKLWVTVGSLATIIMTNVGLPEPIAARITEFAMYVVPIYLGSQGVVDVMTERGLQESRDHAINERSRVNG